ncbi:MAG: DUF2490 domain-containing protein [Bacteroidetes bacterium]|nr:MAG: DUF2490 domain-containing protein [Bacteroidota bacterium]
MKSPVQSPKSQAPSSMHKGFLLAVFVYCLLSTVYSHSQDYPDAGSWNTFNLEYSLHAKFTGLFTQECRIRENFSRLNLFYTNLGIEYKVAKNLKAALIYRWIDKYEDDNSFSFRHRIMLDLMLKHKFGKFVTAYRNRTQVEERDIYSSDDGRVPEWYSRNKFGVKCDMEKRYTPFASVEFRYQFHDPRNIDSDKTWHRTRSVAGVEYKINNKNIFAAYYLVQIEYNVAAPQDQYIVGLEYTLSL